MGWGYSTKIVQMSFVDGSFPESHMALGRMSERTSNGSRSSDAGRARKEATNSVIFGGGGAVAVGGEAATG